MSKSINNMPNQRYEHPKVVEHLASQYVLGTLAPLVHRRVAKLATNHDVLEQAIQYWQQRLVVLDHQTADLPPSETSWQLITERLGMTATHSAVAEQPAPDPEIKINQASQTASHWRDRFIDKLNRWLAIPSYRYASALSVLLLAVVISFYNPLANKPDPLSYVAVLTQPDGQAHLVASTYGGSQKLVINIINAPVIAEQGSLELWVVSKTDQQVRSLGVLPANQSLLERQLTSAQWRLIRDSQSLIVTVEDAGGSAIGEPSETIVSRGLCVRLQEWNKNV